MPLAEVAYASNVVTSKVFTVGECLTQRARTFGVDIVDQTFEDITEKQNIDFDKLSIDAKSLNLNVITETHEEKDTLPLVGEPTYFILKDGSCVLVRDVILTNIFISDIYTSKIEEMSESFLLERWTGRTFRVRLDKESEENTSSDTFSLFDTFKRHRRLVAEAIFGALFFQLMALASPIFLQIILDKVIIYQGYDTLNVLAIVLVMIMVFQSILHFISNNIFGYVSLRINSDLKMHIIKSILRLRASYFDRNPAGKTLTRVKELDAVIDLFAGPQALNLFSSFFFMLAFIVAMFLYSAQLTIIVVVLMFIYFTVAIYLNKRLKDRFSNRFESMSNLDARTVEIINGASAIKANASEQYHQTAYANLLVAFSSAWMRSHKLAVVSMNFTIIVNDLMTIVVIYMGAILVMNGEMTLGVLVAFYLFLTRITGPLMLFTDFWQKLQRARVSIEKANKMDSNSVKPTEKKSNLKNVEMTGDIEFKNVSFRYEEKCELAVNDISIKIEGGSFIALAGLSGSGKSTIAKIIQGLYPVSSGTISIGNVDINKIDPLLLRQSIGVVDQDVFIFNDSVYQNIISGDTSISVSKVIDICKNIGAHEFINNLPERYNTCIGQSGLLLSGGEKQRIAIARALVRNPQILVMDEPSSAMDYHTENLFIKYLPKICERRTVILIAHRLSTIRKAQKIIVINDGAVIENGTHEELIENKGFYSSAYQLQLG